MLRNNIMFLQKLLAVLCLFLYAGGLCPPSDDDTRCSDYETSPADYDIFQTMINSGIVTCSPYNGTMCADIIRPGVDHVLVVNKRAEGNLTELTSILETQWNLLSLATGPTCREAMRRFLCHYYYPVCRNATAVVPAKTVCRDNCCYIKDQLCPTDWAAMYNATVQYGDDGLKLSTCKDQEKYVYAPVPSCCIDVVPTQTVNYRTTAFYITPTQSFSDHYTTSTSPSKSHNSSVMETPFSSSLPSILMQTPFSSSLPSILDTAPAGFGTAIATVGSLLGVAFALALAGCVILLILVCTRRRKWNRSRAGTCVELLPRPSPTYRCKSVEAADASGQGAIKKSNTYSSSFLQAEAYLCPGEGRMVKIPSGYLRHMSAKLLIPGHCLKLLDCVGQGEFGIVYRAYLSGWGEYSAPHLVAVKTMKGCADKTEVNIMLEESAKMKDLNHPNVLGLIGVSLDTGTVPCIIMPFMGNGSLLSYLKKERHTLTVSNAAEQDLITETQRILLSICLQIAKGMEYLSSQKFVHRDLAARNCMIDLNNVIKVADFGLSEDIYAKNYYRQGDSEENKVKLPIKWMAPESLHDGVFSERTDVWSYGVTCWEVFTLGKIPYPGVTPFTLVKYLDEGGRLEKPSNAACSDEIYDIMKSCWNVLPAERPFFAELVTTLTKLLEALVEYLDLNCSKSDLEVPQTSAILSEPSKSTGIGDDSGCRVNTKPLEPPAIVVVDMNGVILCAQLE